MSFFDRFYRCGVRVIKIAIFLFLFFGFIPLGYNLQVFMEKEIPRPQFSEDDHYDGIIVLGGCMNAQLSAVYGRPVITDSCERIFEGMYLHKKFPEAQFVYTGGSGSISKQAFKGADAAKALMIELGVDIEHVIFENQSRNTYENAIFSQDLVKPLADEKWLLVTSALHMPRASRVFCHNGWNVTPYPVDYRTDGVYRVNLTAPLHNYKSLTRAIKEMVGIFAYQITGKLSLNACE